jgi:hypothetical protein
VPVSHKIRLELQELLEELDPVIRRAFKAFIKVIRSDAVLRRIIRLFRAGNVTGALNIIRSEAEQMADAVSKVFIRSARHEIERVNRILATGGKLVQDAPARDVGVLRIVFDPGNKEAAKLMRKQSLDLVKQITDDQRTVIRRVLRQALEAGDNPTSTVRKLRDSIGLTDNQQQAVENYRLALERGSRDALDRKLRDTRFDSSVERVLDDRRILDAAKIERMVSRYSEKMVDYRAKTIARTETMRAVSEARHASWWQVLEQLGNDPDTVTRTWIATDDDRTRDSHADMDDQVVTGMDTPFISGNDEELLYPGDPLAPADEVCNCRCSVVYGLGG